MNQWLEDMYTAILFTPRIWVDVSSALRYLDQGNLNFLKKICFWYVAKSRDAWMQTSLSNLDPNKLMWDQEELLHDPEKCKNLVENLNYLTITWPDIT